MHRLIKTNGAAWHYKFNFYNITNSGLVQYPEFQATECRDYILLPKELEDIKRFNLN
jgi:hypothetical protein